MLILWDMTLLGLEMLASPGGAISIILLGTLVLALGRRIGMGATIRLCLTGGGFASFCILAFAGTNAWFASRTIYAMPIFIATLAGTALGCMALLLMQRGR